MQSQRSADLMPAPLREKCAFRQGRHLRGIDTNKEVVKDTVLAPATQEEIDNTVAVMGGEDWQMWIDAVLL
jgi:trans-2-enoyl-CoA reductase